MAATKGGFLISQIKQIQGRIFGRLLTEAGIDEFNGAQGRILYVLWTEDDLPIVELARRTGLAKTTLTGMLDRLFYKEFTKEEILRFDTMLDYVLKNLEAEEKRYDTKEPRTAENENPDNKNS